ncbi:hypothetical protein ACRARG_17700 [Pseudooceanicola sp. C21-150M6]|uniref:hypothetical protein n=1 Tax=Pseudooceanicola sp. C21-150M6 TaxID=3434355 RepID=UPI003D7FD624
MTPAQNPAFRTCPTCRRLIAQGEDCTTLACVNQAKFAPALDHARTKRDRLEAQRQLLRDRTDRLFPNIAKAAGQNPDDIPATTVPSCNPEFAPRNTDRERVMARRLMDLIDEVFDPATAEDEERMARFRALADEQEVQKKPEIPAIAASCIACQGACCRQGMSMQAFISVETIAVYRLLNPGCTPSEILTAYLSRLPQEAVVNSCLFHGVEGCTLPREMRSQTCNSFECGDRRSLWEQFEKLGRDDHAVTISVKGYPNDFTEASPLEGRIVEVDPQRGITITRIEYRPDLRD